MSDRLFERAVLDWLEEGSDTTPRPAIDAVLLAVKTTPQERGRWIPRRYGPVSTKLRIAVTVAVVAILAATALILGGGAGPTTSTPAPPTAAASETASRSAPPAASPTSTLMAPLGYPGSGLIEYTKHDAAGNDVLWLVDPSGANAREVGPACCGLFSPDGSKLAYAAPGVTPAGMTRPDSLLGVEIVDLTGAGATITVPTDCGACAILELNYEPDAWSPDGRYIGITMWSDTDPLQGGLGLADRDFNPPWDWPKLRATGNHADVPTSFSPDSTKLLFMRTERTSGPTGFGTLFILDLKTGDVRQISPGGVTVWANGITQGPASWSPDGTEVAFAGQNSSGGTSIYVVGAESGAVARTVVAQVVGASSARFSPDGSLIAFDQRSGGGAHDMFVVPAAGGTPTNLSASFAPGVCCGQWSPDGTALLASGTNTDDDHSNLFIVAADGSGVWQLTTETNVYTGFLWGPGTR
jgi:Tol biopolymer transport system component